ncbi:putative cell division cycle protein [Thermochaetoides thermophila DSM 1495]|uniref:Putative cell division cycle protein n=1 Tax=Chaetomium thermophilum (strain DSM 1495 / CBS 144.50 / IMI 039719) TaxID=759272 RepID=G0S4I6_CHATD|nr:putative cell division cycle protein [Thermochaetoides thermophila DSM 1495]EGS20464.1 putative cell division cycle protein [Thermochaetoides thermophila DSM 1495]
MPGIEDLPPQEGPLPQQTQLELKFPPVSRDHILHCSYDYWFPKYRTNCIRSKIIPLTPEFVEYIREDGIILADEGSSTKKSSDDTAASDDDDDDWEPSFTRSDYPPPLGDDDDVASSSDTDEEPPQPTRLPPDKRFPSLHAEITSAIQSLGGAAAPKLNWSSPKDATWISRHPNTVKCTSANDVYILLKSSSFISHDLEHAFDDTVPQGHPPDFKPVLVLRAFFNPLPSLEFRCFVRDRQLIGIAQRDLNYYQFLQGLRPQIVARTKELFAKMKDTFPDPCWVFDVYIPEADYDDDESDEEKEGNGAGTDGRKREKVAKLGRARLIDINPWAPRTDTLLFDWRELLEMKVPGEEEQNGDSNSSSEEEEDEEDLKPEVRLIEKDDPAAYNFSSPQYSAHKLPKEVVDASTGGQGGMREFLQKWRQMTGAR